MKQSSGDKIVEQKFFQRLSLQFRIQHIVLFSSVGVLIITGIPMLCILGKPGEIWWSQSTVQALGGITIYRYIHRVAATALAGISLYHFLYTIFTREGRREFIELLPQGKDVIDVTMNFLYFLGLRKERPRFGRYTYYEKFDYWAVYWGCVIMGVSGLVLWFPEIAAKYVPWLTYTLSAEIHADEAILAALVLLIWHSYNVHLNPSHFPGSLLWWHGKISHEEMVWDHPLEYNNLVRKA